MMREVLGAIMAGTMGTMLLWFILPMLNLAYISITGQIKNNPNPIISQNPTTLQMIALGDTIFLALGFLVFFVTGFIIISYATRRDPFAE